MRSVLRSLASKAPASKRGLATAVEDLSLGAGSDASTSTAASTSAAGKWTPYTQRTGLIAKKRGMTGLWDRDGRRWPVTVLQVSPIPSHMQYCILTSSSIHVRSFVIPNQHLRTLYMLFKSDRPINQKRRQRPSYWVISAKLARIQSTSYKSLA